MQNSTTPYFGRFCCCCWNNWCRETVTELLLFVSVWQHQEYLLVPLKVVKQICRLQVIAFTFTFTLQIENIFSNNNLQSSIVFCIEIIFCYYFCTDKINRGPESILKSLSSRYNKITCLLICELIVSRLIGQIRAK